MTEDTPEREEYEVVVVGGGPAGQTAALYTTRLGHDTALVDRGGGRAAMMQEVHNVLGVHETTSGNEYLTTGKDQLAEYGCTLHRDDRRATRPPAATDRAGPALLSAL
jgi:thioredoxin reductase (NADPH)